MKKINVIDLDKTLIPFDSYAKLIKKNLFSMLFFSIFLIIILRLLKIISQKEFSKRAYTLCLKAPNKNIKSLIEEICDSIDKEVLDEINKNTTSETINILCSASPDFYVKEIAEKLGWIGYGSSMINNQYEHLYGEGKVTKIKSDFPPLQFKYNYSISDSKSDLELLKLFDKYTLIELPSKQF